MPLNLCSLKAKILPQVLSKGAIFLPAIYAIILSSTLSFYGMIWYYIIISGKITGEATSKKSQKTLINGTSYIKTL